VSLNLFLTVGGLEFHLPYL